MSSCRYFITFLKVGNDFIIVKLIMTSFYSEVSGPCAQLNRIDTPNSPDFRL